jgi:hypothetical protein
MPLRNRISRQSGRRACSAPRWVPQSRSPVPTCSPPADCLSPLKMGICRMPVGANCLASPVATNTASNFSPLFTRWRWTMPIPVSTTSGIFRTSFSTCNRLHFGAAHSAGLHGAQLALDPSLGDARPKPPPAHHDAGIVGRVFERPPKSFNVCIGGHGQNGRGRNQNGKTSQGSNHPHTATFA